MKSLPRASVLIGVVKLLVQGIEHCGLYRCLLAILVEPGNKSVLRGTIRIVSAYTLSVNQVGTDCGYVTMRINAHFVLKHT